MSKVSSAIKDVYFHARKSEWTFIDHRAMYLDTAMPDGSTIRLHVCFSRGILAIYTDNLTFDLDSIAYYVTALDNRLNMIECTADEACVAVDIVTRFMDLPEISVLSEIIDSGTDITSSEDVLFNPFKFTQFQQSPTISDRLVQKLAKLAIG